MTCKRFESLFGPYLDSRLPAKERARLEAHVDGCAGCREQLQTWQAASASLRGQVTATVPAGLAERAWRAALEGRPEPGLLEGFILAGRRTALAGAVTAAVVWSAVIGGGGLETLQGRAEPAPQDPIELAAAIWIGETNP